MIRVLFVCHGSTTGSQELAAVVGQNGANRGIRESMVLCYGFTTNEGTQN